MASTECFNIEKVTDVFAKSLLEDDDVLLEEYLTAYEEINKFFQLMGSVFSFVSKDIRSKLDILIEFRTTELEHFTSIKNMISYEKESDLFKDKSYVSGSRTLLRLHRGLEFVYEFLMRIQEIEESEKSYTCCKDAYNITLAKHHPFLIRKGALVAMHAMPTKGELLNRVCQDIQKAIETLPDMLRNTRTVYDRTDELYTKYDLHNLP